MTSHVSNVEPFVFVIPTVAGRHWSGENNELRGTNTISSWHNFSRCFQHTLTLYFFYFFFEENLLFSLRGVFLLLFFLTLRINRTERDLCLYSSLQIYWIQRCWSSEIFCGSWEEMRHTHRAHITIKDSVRKRDCFFFSMFVSPRVNSVFLQNYTGQQGLQPALHWENVPQGR